MERNYEYALDKFRKDLFSWINFKLSNEGKAMVVKVYGMPQFNHIATILPDPPKDTLKRIVDCAVKFLQTGGYKTTKQLILSPKSVGGLGLIRFTNTGMN